MTTSKEINWEDCSETRTAKVQVDGVVYRSVFRCVTGPDGWIELAIRDNRGRILCDPKGQVLKGKVYGYVEVEFK